MPNFAPWYRREEYALMREILDDGETLPLTFDEWEKNAESERAVAKREGVSMIPVLLAPDEFFSFCREKKISPNRATAAFTAGSRGAASYGTVSQFSLHRGRFAGAPEKPLASVRADKDLHLRQDGGVVQGRPHPKRAGRSPSRLASAAGSASNSMADDPVCAGSLSNQFFSAQYSYPALVGRS